MIISCLHLITIKGKPQNSVERTISNNFMEGKKKETEATAGRRRRRHRLLPYKLFPFPKLTC